MTSAGRPTDTSEVTVVVDAGPVTVDVTVLFEVTVVERVIVLFTVMVLVMVLAVVVFVGGVTAVPANVTVACAVWLLNESVTVIVYVPKGVAVEFVDGQVSTVMLYAPAALVLP